MSLRAEARALVESCPGWSSRVAQRMLPNDPNGNRRRYYERVWARQARESLIVVGVLVTLLVALVAALVMLL